MKKSQILLLLTLLIVLVGQASGEVTLDVDVPPGWMGDALFDEDWGYWGYSTENSFVVIYYDTDVPEELIGQEDNPDALIAYAENNCLFTPEESGTDIMNGQTAGYVHSATDYGYARYIVYV